ncbi:hypothetical protein SAMN05216282_11915 [Cryobacterium psychrotolerans]|uniref:Uncharacterized protein n=1 Tax=Cryobacterium psychrotolerans TaxID=386301 RepID=A0A1G9G0Y0_9MICO|nr:MULTISPECIES: hypothetical protein [Cryobacterium]SDK94310.1 hypothetical protein SAMN05216282_11915 [Cryobacterium psychrotolerans]
MTDATTTQEVPTDATDATVPEIELLGQSGGGCCGGSACGS